jgi:hypothetical protein
MSNMQDEDIKRWTAKRKSALVLDIIQGKTVLCEALKGFFLICLAARSCSIFVARFFAA